MSKVTLALEAAVAIVIANTPAEGAKPTARQRANVDKAFAEILRLIAPRIRHFIRQYGLVAHWDDAEQCCAIAVHRAIQAYDPEKAQFTTYVNWQIRGELQSLRFRLMTDQRPSAKKVEATTVSLHAITSRQDGEEASLESVIEDSEALALTEAGASDYLANAAMLALVDEYVRHLRSTGLEQLYRRPRPKRIPAGAASAPGAKLPRHLAGIDPAELEKLEQKLARDRDIIERRVFELAPLGELDLDSGVTKERIRQITKRASKAIATLTANNPRFAVMAEYCSRDGATTGRRKWTGAEEATTPLLPQPDQLHNQLARVVAIDPASLQQSWSPNDSLGDDDSAMIASDMLQHAQDADAGTQAVRH